MVIDWLLFPSLIVTITDVCPQNAFHVFLTFTVYTHAANPVKYHVPCHTHPLNWYCILYSLGDHTTVTVPSDTPHALVFVHVPIAVRFVMFHTTVTCAFPVHQNTHVPKTLYVPVPFTTILHPVLPLLQLYSVPPFAVKMWHFTHYNLMVHYQ